MIVEKATAQEIRNKAIENGMTTLMKDGWYNVMKGVTTPEEVMKVCQDLEPEDTSNYEENKERIIDLDNTAERYYAPDERRVYLRVPARVGMKYRLVEKGPGEIVFIDNVSAGQDKRENIFTGEVFTKPIAQEEFEKEVYREVNSTTANLSAGGAVFESKYLLPESSIIELIMDIPGMPRPVKCLAKVVRTEKDLPRLFNIAVCYLDMSGKDRKIVDDFVRKENDKRTIKEIRKP